MNNKPLISIIIPVYNRSQVIKRTLDSILGQTYPNWECLVVDDSSTDNTRQTVMDYHFIDKRISLYSNTRKKGAQGARNEGILHAQGEWILLFDSDDTVSPFYLERVVESIIDENTIITCYGQMIDENNGERLDVLSKIHEGNNHVSLLNGSVYITMSSALINKNCLIKIGLLDEDCPSHHELETHLRLSRLYNYHVVPEVLWYYFVGHDDSISVSKPRHIAGLLYIARKYRWDYRYNAYRHFIVRMKRLWKFADGLPEHKKFFHRQILMIVPELPLLLLRNSFKWKHN